MPALGVVGGLVNAFGPALVHASHRQTTNALASIGLNLGLPFGAGLVGMGAGLSVLAGANGGLDGLAAMSVSIAIGAGLGSIAAIVLDATWLGYEDQAPPSPIALTPALSFSADEARTPLAGLSLAF